MTDKPYFCRLEYLTPDGWTVGHAGISLLNPSRYVKRLAERGKFGRAIVLDVDLVTELEVFEPDDLPDPSVLVPSSTRIPKLPDATAGVCPICDESHPAPYDGSCLL